MSRSPFLPVPDHAGPIARRIGKLLPALTGPARYRIAEMAVAMREAAENHGGCQHHHLREAGFTDSEIEFGWPLAKRAVEAEPAWAPLPMVPAFTPGDCQALAAFNRRRRAALDTIGAPYARAA